MRALRTVVVAAALGALGACGGGSSGYAGPASASAPTTAGATAGNAASTKPEPSIQGGLKGAIGAISSAKSAVAANGGSQVVVQDFTWPAMSFKAGTTITLMTIDAEEHQLKAVDGSFQSEPFSVGAPATFVVPTTPGSYPIVCGIHARMKGTLTVTP